jgi:hypothetical protein
VPRIYANDEERRAATQKRQKFRCAIVVFKRAMCNGAQHEETWCMTNTAEDQLHAGQQMALRDL